MVPGCLALISLYCRISGVSCFCFAMARKLTKNCLSVELFKRNPCVSLIEPVYYLLKQLITPILNSAIPYDNPDRICPCRSAECRGPCPNANRGRSPRMAYRPEPQRHQFQGPPFF